MAGRWVYVGLYMFGVITSRYYSQWIFQNEQMPFPLAFSFMENLFIFLLCLSVQYYRPRLAVKSLTLWVALVFAFALFFGVDFMLENIALNVWNPSLDSIVKSTCIVVTALIQMMFGQTISKARWGLMFAIIFGVTLTMVNDKMDFVWLGFIVSTLAMITSSLIAVLSDFILSRFTGTHPLHLLTFSSLFAMYIVFPFFAAQEGMAFFNHWIDRPWLMLTFLLVDSVFVAMAQFSLIKITEQFGAVQLTLVDALLVVAMALMDELIAHTPFNLMRWTGIFTVVACFLLDATMK